MPGLPEFCMQITNPSRVADDYLLKQIVKLHPNLCKPLNVNALDIFVQ